MATTTATAPRPLANSYTAGKLPRWTPWTMLVVSWLVFGAIYYFVFRFAITKWNLPTPGREPEEEVEDLTKA